jgi:anthranilate phosphoribosyltransferase
MGLNRLKELLKKKGIGPEGSKSLQNAELIEVEVLLTDDSYSLTTRATILTALLMLPPSEAEKSWLEKLKNEFRTLLPPNLHFMIRHEEAATVFEKYLCTTLAGTDLKYTQAGDAMQLILTDESVPAFQKGAFLEAQRLKRESFDENKAFFDTLWEYTERLQTELPVLIDICDNYDGFNRYYNLAPFIAALISSCGFPCLIHGIDSVAPKFGVTSNRIIEQGKGQTKRSHESVLKNLQDTSIGWAYIDQSVFHPRLHHLKNIRKEMVKRPFLATFEKMMQPIRASEGNFILTGFTHAHYRTEVAEQLLNQNKAAAAIVIKGLEGSSCPPLNRETIQILVNNDGIKDQEIQPTAFLRQEHTQLPFKSVTAEQTYAAGIEALQGIRNESFYQMLYYAGMALSDFGLLTKEKSMAYAEEHLLNGKAYQHFQKGLI